MKTAEAWVEEVAFVSCPECEASIELGTGLVWSGPVEWECPECAESFLVEPPK